MHIFHKSLSLNPLADLNGRDSLLKTSFNLFLAKPEINGRFRFSAKTSFTINE